jgi:hypothetical protein
MACSIGRRERMARRRRPDQHAPPLCELGKNLESVVKWLSDTFISVDAIICYLWRVCLFRIIISSDYIF